MSLFVQKLQYNFSYFSSVFPVPFSPYPPQQVLRKMRFKPFVSCLAKNFNVLLMYIREITHTSYTHKIDIVYLFFISRNCDYMDSVSATTNTRIFLLIKRLFPLPFFL